MIILHKTSFFVKAITLLIVAFLLFSSCKKEDTSGFVQAAEVAAGQTNSDLDATYLFSVFQKVLYDTALMHRDTAMIDSARVYRAYDSISELTSYLIDYGVGITSPDFKYKSGQIHAILNYDWQLEDATLQATFDNYTINGIKLIGSVSYTNVAGSIATGYRYSFDANILFSINDQTSIDYAGSKEITWTDGYLTPLDYEKQFFTVSGSSTGIYNSSTNAVFPNANISLEITRNWQASFACHKLIRQGNINLQVSDQNMETPLNGEFIDSDQDGCSDKIMLKNQDNYGYPFYI